LNQQPSISFKSLLINMLALDGVSFLLGSLVIQIGQHGVFASPSQQAPSGSMPSKVNETAVGGTTEASSGPDNQMTTNQSSAYGLKAGLCEALFEVHASVCDKITVSLNCRVAPKFTPCTTPICGGLGGILNPERKCYVRIKDCSLCLPSLLPKQVTNDTPVSIANNTNKVNIQSLRGSSSSSEGVDEQASNKSQGTQMAAWPSQSLGSMWPQLKETALVGTTRAISGPENQTATNRSNVSVTATRICEALLEVPDFVCKAISVTLNCRLAPKFTPCTTSECGGLGDIFNSKKKCYIRHKECSLCLPSLR